MPNEKGGKKIIAVNRKARHDYFVEDTYEAGIALYGTEVKSVRAGQVNLKDSYCSVKNGELYALGIHISPYEKGNIFNRDPLREKKLLMHKKEILKLFQYTTVIHSFRCQCIFQARTSRSRSDSARVKSSGISVNPTQKQKPDVK